MRKGAIEWMLVEVMIKPDFQFSKDHFVKYELGGGKTGAKKMS